MSLNAHRILQSSDDEFLSSAYLSLLKRPPDHTGKKYYLGALQIGISRIQILRELSESPESQEKNGGLSGLRFALLLQQIERAPIFGLILKFFHGRWFDNALELQIRALYHHIASLKLSVEPPLDLSEPSQQISAAHDELQEKTSVISEPVTDLENKSSSMHASRRVPFVIQFEYLETKSPYAAGENDDTRELAVGYKSLLLIDRQTRSVLLDLDFVSNGNASAYRLFGFSESESWGTWSVGKRSALLVWLDAPPSEELDMVLEAKTYSNAFHSSDVIVTTNAGHICNLMVSIAKPTSRSRLAVDHTRQALTFLPASMPTMDSNNVSLGSSLPVVSILILNFNKPMLAVLSAISALSAGISVPYEILIIDNGSSDDNFSLLQAAMQPVRIIRIPVNRYFGEGNNIGAEAARGEYLLFLNNDAFLPSGTIEALLGGFAHSRECGIVGPIFRYPDGRLQEVGGFIRPDGSAYQRGKFDVAFEMETLSEFGEVDYISAACLMIRANRFKDIGGFNYRFDPAYYEDTDLCFRVKLRGEKVFLVKNATCIHIENATTSDKAHNAGANAVVEHHKKIFLSVWGDYLANRADSTPPAHLLPDAPSVSQVEVHTQAQAQTKISCAVYSPFPLVPGGGERYILATAQALNHFGQAAFVSPDIYSNLRLSNVMFDLGLQPGTVIALPEQKLTGIKLEKVVVMGNEFYPSRTFESDAAYFVCQFPFPLNEEQQQSDQLAKGIKRLKKYKKVIVNSEFTKLAYETEIAKHGVAIPVAIVYPPVATERLIRLKGERKPWIISIGRFSDQGHQKRQDALIDALKLTSFSFRKKWKLVLCGSVPNDARSRAYFRQLQDRVSDDINVEFVISPSAKRLDTLLSQSSVYAHATGLGVTVPADFWKCEHFGITMVEAMAAGCHALCYEVGGGAEIVTKLNCGATYTTVEDLARQFELSKVGCLGDDFRRRVAHHFSDQAFATKMIAVVS